MTPAQLAKSGTEHGHQRALFAWMALNRELCPDFAFVFAIPNGGLRDKATAGRLKAEGVKAGVPDICAPLRRIGYCGLYIELKRPSSKTATTKRAKGNVANVQSKFIEKLRQEGYAAGSCVGWEAARDILVWYFQLHGFRNE